MALQKRTTQLALRDTDGWLTLGVSRIQSGTVACSAGLIEGKHFEIDYDLGNVRPINGYTCEEACTFAFAYDDRAEEFAAVAKQQRADAEAALAVWPEGSARDAAARVLRLVG